MSVEMMVGGRVELLVEMMVVEKVEHLVDKSVLVKVERLVATRVDEMAVMMDVDLVVVLVVH